MSPRVEQRSSQAMAALGQDCSIELPGSARFVARQPILDLRGRIHGYELLYRKGAETAFSGDCELASRTVLDDTVLFGLERFTGGSQAFINCTSETLTEDLVSVLPNDMAVLELLETVEPSADLIAACTNLKARKFKLALDDFVWEPKFVPLVELADYIKVDFLATGAAARQELIRQLKGKRIMLLAEKVETVEEYKQACSEGFSLFQGYYFCRPELVKNRKVPSNHFAHFEILHLLQADPIDWDKLSHAVRRDESLTYRLLRLINSVGYAVREEINSVRSALVLLGEEDFRRVATLAIATELNTGRPPEILKMAMVRARFCELAAVLCAFSANEQYLLGMLSLLSAMLAVPMEELTPSLPLRREIREALQGTVNREGRMLEWLKGHECGDWVSCEAILESNGLRQEQVSKCYTEAIFWAENQFRAVQ
ncbi:MAG TPA: HDOD domain-containing protein [Terracidiphilus sp.]|nr:HDOD domain-containing protein [Terracidiphilus sp.]